MLAFVGFDAGEFTRTEQLVIEQIRLPRIVVGASVGMALGVAGATMQGLFRNPMADPGIIGVSTGGAVGAVVAIATGATGLFFLALPTFAFVGALVATFLVYGIAAVGGHFSMATLLLAGVAVNAFLGAIVSAIIILLPDNGALREILFWLAGGLDSRSWEHVRISAPLIIGAAAVIMLMSRDLNLLMLGDDEARSMGVRVGSRADDAAGRGGVGDGRRGCGERHHRLRRSGDAAHSPARDGPGPPRAHPHERGGWRPLRHPRRHRRPNGHPTRGVSRRRADGIRRRAVLHPAAHQEQTAGLLALTSIP